MTANVILSNSGGLMPNKYTAEKHKLQVQMSNSKQKCISIIICDNISTSKYNR